MDSEYLKMDALSTLIKPLANKIQLSTLPLHIHHIVLAYVLYELIFRYLSPWLSAKFSFTYRRLDRREKIGWNAHVVSMIHSLFISTLALHVIFTDPDRQKAQEDWRVRLWSYSYLSGRAQGLAAGYFLWETLVSIDHLDALGWGSLVHGVAASSITCLAFRPFGNYYVINYLLYELSTPFLNVHRFMDTLGMTRSRAYVINGMLLVGTFFGCRIVWGFYNTVLVYNDVWQAWNSTTHLAKLCEGFLRASNLTAWFDVPWRCTALPTWLGVYYVGANLTLCLLNLFWFGKMVSFLIERYLPKGRVGGGEKKTK